MNQNASKQRLLSFLLAFIIIFNPIGHLISNVVASESNDPAIEILDDGAVYEIETAEEVKADQVKTNVIQTRMAEANVNATMVESSEISANYLPIVPPIMPITVNITPPATGLPFELLVGETYQLSANVTGSLNQDVTWEIFPSNSPIASVDPDGTVRALSPDVGAPGFVGVVARSVSNPNVTDMIQLWVGVRPMDVRIDTPTINVNSFSVNEPTYTLKATVTPAEAFGGVIWSSSDSSILSVDSTTGDITPISPGTATITVETTIATTFDGSPAIDTLDITVVPVIPADGVRLEVRLDNEVQTADLIELTVGDELDVQVFLTPDNVTDITLPLDFVGLGTSMLIPGSNIMDPVLPNLDADGRVIMTALTPGAGRIFFTIDIPSLGIVNEIFFFDVVIHPIQVTSVTINEGDLTLDIGATENLTATLAPSTANQNVEWASSDSSIATVNANGDVVAVGLGSVEITATSVTHLDVTDTVTVTVGPITAKSVTISHPALISLVDLLIISDVEHLTVEVLPGSADQRVEWVSSNPSIATVNAAGIVTPHDEGFTTIRATSVVTPTIFHEISVFIGPGSTLHPVQPPVLAIDFELDPAFILMPAGQYHEVGVNLLPSDTTDILVPLNALTTMPGWSISANTGAINPAIAQWTPTIDVADSLVIDAISPGMTQIEVELLHYPSWTTMTATMNVMVTSYVPIPVDSVAIAGVGLTDTVRNISLDRHESVQLTAEVLPNRASNPAVEWESSDDAIVKVDATGYIQAVGVGTVDITLRSVENANIYDVIEVTVEAVALTGIHFNPDEHTITVGQLLDLANDLIFSPTTATNQAVTWESLDEAIATIDADGVVTGVAVGSVAIRAVSEDGGHEAYALVHVNEAPPIVATDFEFDPSFIIIPAGQYREVAMNLLPAGTSDRWVSWDDLAEGYHGWQVVSATAVNASIVDWYIDSAWTLSGSLGLEALTPGMTQINVTIMHSVTFDMITRTLNVMVTSYVPIPVDSVAIAGAGLTDTVRNISLDRHESVQLTAEVLPNRASNPAVEWESSDDAIVKVDATGYIEAVGVGTVDITLRSVENANIYDVIEVTVEAVALTGIHFNPDEHTITVGQLLDLANDLIFSPTTATNQAVTWESLDEAIATIDADGVVTGVAVGSVAIRAVSEDGGHEAYALVHVNEAPPVSIISIEIDQGDFDLVHHASEQLTVTFNPANATNQEVTWTSDDLSIATVDADGVVTGIAVGTAVISAVSDDDVTIYDEITVDVIPLPVTNVSHSGNLTAMHVGTNQTVTAFVNPENATDPELTWTSSNPAVVSVAGSVTTNTPTATNVLYATGLGVATITISSNDGPTAFLLVAVVIPVTDVTINASDFDLAIGETETLTTTILPANATNHNVTWSTSDDAVATVDAAGVVTGVSEGNAVITVTTVDGRFTDTLIVNVIPSSVVPPVLVTGVHIDSVAHLVMDVAEQRKFHWLML